MLIRLENLGFCEVVYVNVNVSLRWLLSGMLNCDDGVITYGERKPSSPDSSDIFAGLFQVWWLGEVRGFIGRLVVLID
jgi:hypothetical protein